MTAPAGTLQQFQAIGYREDLSDIIYDISPMDTPFMSNIAKDSAKAVYHEWQTDSLATAVNTNAAIEGDDTATANTADVTTRLGNYCQISRKIPRVSGTMRSIDLAGRKDELSYQIAKRGRELKRDIEMQLCSAKPAVAGGAATARQSAGVDAWIATNEILPAASTAQTTPGATAAGVPLTAPTLGTAGAFVVADLKLAIAACWNEGGDPTLIMTGKFNKGVASGFAGIGTMYRDGQPNGDLAPGSIIGAADVYISDFGTHHIVANRYQPVGTVFFIDPEYWCVSYLRPIQTEDLSKTGDSERKLLLAEYTLKSKNEKASGKIATTTSS